MEGIRMPGPVISAMFRLAGIGHKATPMGVQVIAVQLRPAEGVSLKTALLTVTVEVPVPFAMVTVYAVVCPAVSVVTPFVLLMLKFADPKTESISVALSLVGLVSM